MGSWMRTVRRWLQTSLLQDVPHVLCNTRHLCISSHLTGHSSSPLSLLQNPRGTTREGTRQPGPHSAPHAQRSHQGFQYHVVRCQS